MRLVQTNPHNHCRGFSLIELMVIMSILGILIATALAQYDGMKDRGYDKQAEVYVNSAIKVLKAMEVDSDSDHNFEVLDGTVISDTSNLIGHFPELQAGQKAVSVIITKTGADIYIASFHCHGTKKYVHDSAAYGEYIVRTAPITNADMTAKCP